MKAKTALIATIASVGIASAANAQTFSNPAPITIANSGSTPYPSTILVSGIVNAVTDVNVTLTGFSHAYVYDVDILLVGPTGQTLVLMSDVGDFTLEATNANITLDDEGGVFPGAGILNSGSYQPLNNGLGDPFNAPAPPVGPNTTLAGFDGLNPNGTWSLYIMDDFSADNGSIAGGWSITFTQVPAPGALALLGLAGLVGKRRRR